MKIPNSFFSILIFLLGSAQVSFAQIGYSLSISNEDYQTLENPQIITQDNYDKDTAYPIVLPFEFEMLDQRSDTLWVTSNGFIALGGEYNDTNYYAINAFEFALQSFLVDASTSPIQYEITGDDGNQIAKIEWKMSYFRALEGLFDFVNMQVWLYEQNNSIELRYGNSTTELIQYQFEVEDSLGRFGGIVGVAHVTPDLYSGTNLTADSESPVLEGEIARDAQTIGPFRLDFPASGTVYTLTKISTATVRPDVENNWEMTFRADVNEIKLETFEPDASFQYNIYDAMGKSHLNGKLPSSTNRIDVSSLRMGIYVLFISNDAVSKSWKFHISE